MAGSRFVLRRILVATVVVIAAAVVAPAKAGAAPDVVGQWQSIDRDGSPQTMSIVRTTTSAELSVKAESARSSACGGLRATADGSGALSADSGMLLVNYSVACACGSFTTRVNYAVNPEGQTLTDDFGVVWRRG